MGRFEKPDHGNKRGIGSTQINSAKNLQRKLNRQARDKKSDE